MLEWSMVIREILPQEQERFDAVASHPLQTWGWGEFKVDTGVNIMRLGAFEGPKLLETYQITTHTVPKLGWRIGYFPRGNTPDEKQMFALKTAADKLNLVSIKLEPNVYAPVETASQELEPVRSFLTAHNCQPSRALFTPHSFMLDITKSEEELLASFKSKTRYNIRVAEKNGVEVIEDNSNEAFTEYIKLWRETTKRQAFYSHDQQYHEKMWQHMHGNGIAHLLKAIYQGKTLATWVVFVSKGVLYYPYGASSREHREVMANNLLAWEAIKFGKRQGCRVFDMWGSLGPDPDKTDPWYGFHRFKEGYGGTLMEFVGTYDYVVDPQKYKLFTELDKWRWKLLRLRSKLPF